jgi:hypothetical protein
MSRKVLAGIVVFACVGLVIYVRGMMYGAVGGFQPYITNAMDNAGTSSIWSLWLGILFGLVSCPVCGVPLAAYIAGGEENMKAAFNASVIFTVGRFCSFILLGIVAGIAGSMLPYMLAPYAIGIAGVFMVALSADLLELIELRESVTGFVFKHLKIPTFSVNHPIEYMAWGTVTGMVCTIEASVFLIPISAVAMANAAMSAGIVFSVLKAVLIIVAFGVGAFIPPTSLIMLAKGSVSMASKYVESDVLRFVKYTGAVILLLLGVQYIAMGLNAATTLR